MHDLADFEDVAKVELWISRRRMGDRTLSMLEITLDAEEALTRFRERLEGGGKPIPARPE